MAANTNNRIPIKWIRDRAKSAYTKEDCCFVCGSREELELHHLASITKLLGAWVTKTGVDVSTDEAVLAMRDEFIDNHRKEIYDDVKTLCNTHHVKLHSIFGVAPDLNSGPKQLKWLEIQKAKVSGTVVTKTSFSKFC